MATQKSKKPEIITITEWICQNCSFKFFTEYGYQPYSSHCPRCGCPSEINRCEVEIYEKN